jgi:hypothetical protein
VPSIFIVQVSLTASCPSSRSRAILFGCIPFFVCSTPRHTHTTEAPYLQRSASGLE